MKISSFILFILFTCLLVPLQAQKPSFFEGSINFSVEIKGSMASMLKENEPNNKLLMHIRSGSYIVQLSGGKYPKTFIFVADSNYEYSIDMANKRAFRFSSHSDLSQLKEEQHPVAKPTGKQEEVNGIVCDEYRIKKGDTYFSYYVNDQYRIDPANYPEDTRAKASFLAKGLKGRIPLKTIKKQRQLIVVTTATKVTPRTFDPEQFLIPRNFEVKGRDYRY